MFQQQLSPLFERAVRDLADADLRAFMLFQSAWLGRRSAMDPAAHARRSERFLRDIAAAGHS